MNTRIAVARHNLVAKGRVCLLAAALAVGVQPRAADAQIGATARDTWQRVDEVFAALDVDEGDWIADVGAGDGFFSLRLSPRVGPLGRVLAEDINEDVLRDLQQRARREGLLNIETILGAADDPRLPAGVLHGVLVVNAYHEMDRYQAMLGGIKRALRPGGRLVILDTAPRDSSVSRGRQIAQHDIAMLMVEQDLVAAGFDVIDRRSDFVRSRRNRQWMLVAVVAQDRAR
jgi:SAM-dependent methyltransferase